MEPPLSCAAETNGVGRQIRVREVAVVQSQDALVKIRPAAASDDAVLAAVRTRRILFRTEGVIVRLIPIVDPFPDVTRHIIESESIRFIRSHRRRAIRITETCFLCCRWLTATRRSIQFESPGKHLLLNATARR